MDAERILIWEAEVWSRRTYAYPVDREETHAQILSQELKQAVKKELLKAA